MAGLKRAEAQRLMDASNGVAAYVNPTGPKTITPTTTVPTSTAAGTAVAGVTPQTVNWRAATAADPAVATNNGALTFSGMPACTVVGADEKDSAGVPRNDWGGPLSSNKIVNAGDTFTIDDAQLVKQLGG